jgi:hypothetical protein
MAIEQQVLLFGGPLNGEEVQSTDMTDTLEFTADLRVRSLPPIAEDAMDQTRAYRHVYTRTPGTPEFEYGGWK